MPNEYYDHTTYPSNGALGSSSAMRSELDSIEAGFAKLPTLAGNGSKIVAVNSGATALETIATTGTGSIVRSASPTFTGTITAAAISTSGNVSIGGTLGVTGATTLSSTLAAGNTTITGTLAVSSTSALSGVVTVNPAGSTTSAQIELAGTTNNWIGWNSNGTAAPAFTTRSAGTKLVFNKSLSGVALDYAIGVESGFLWQSVNTTAAGYRWYAGSTTHFAQLTSAAGFTCTGFRATSVVNTCGVGYGTGAGGTATQGSGSGKGTAVTLSTMCGEITMDGAALAADTTVSFVLTNTAIQATDLLVLNHVGTGTLGAYTLNANCGSGTATIYVRNVTAGSLSEAIVIGFAVFKAVTS